MDKQTQDKLWSELSEESQKKIYEDYMGYKISSHSNEQYKASAIEDMFGEHNLNPKPLTYEDVARELFFEKESYRIDTYSRILSQKLGYLDRVENPNNCISKKQAEKLFAINKLLNVASYLNKNEDGTPWKPDWSNDEDKWSLCVDPDTNQVRTIKVYHSEVNRYIVYFRTEELAKQAIQILGEDTVRLALTTEY